MDEVVEEQLMIITTLLLTRILFVYICNLDREYDVNNSNLLSLLRCLCCRGILMCIADECSSGACVARPRVPVYDLEYNYLQFPQLRHAQLRGGGH